MIIQHLHNVRENGELVSKWILFKTTKQNYTKAIIEKVRKYLAEHVNPKFENVNDESIKGWYTGKYEDESLTDDTREDGSKWYELRDRGSFSCLQVKHVTIVNID